MLVNDFMFYGDVGCIQGRYHHPAHIERLQSTPPGLPVTLNLCSTGIPNKTGYTVGSRGEEDMLSVAIKILLDPDPRKYLKVCRLIIDVIICFCSFIDFHLSLAGSVTLQREYIHRKFL